MDFSNPERTGATFEPPKAVSPVRLGFGLTASGLLLRWAVSTWVINQTPSSIFDMALPRNYPAADVIALLALLMTIGGATLFVVGILINHWKTFAR